MTLWWPVILLRFVECCVLWVRKTLGRIEIRLANVKWTDGTN